MTRTIMLLTTTLLASAACNLGKDEAPSGDVNVAIQQALTGQTTSAGTFTLIGAVTDEGQTTEELTFGGPLTQPSVPVTFQRVLTGRKGTMTISGSAVLTWSSPATATIAGSWEVKSATGVYATGRGTLTGNADFAATPPTGQLEYRGVINRLRRPVEGRALTLRVL